MCINTKDHEYFICSSRGTHYAVTIRENKTFIIGYFCEYSLSRRINSGGFSLKVNLKSIIQSHQELILELLNEYSSDFWGFFIYVSLSQDEKSKTRRRADASVLFFCFETNRRSLIQGTLICLAATHGTIVMRSICSEV